MLSEDNGELRREVRTLFPSPGQSQWQGWSGGLRGTFPSFQVWHRSTCRPLLTNDQRPRFPAFYPRDLACFSGSTFLAVRSVVVAVISGLSSVDCVLHWGQVSLGLQPWAQWRVVVLKRLHGEMDWWVGDAWLRWYNWGKENTAAQWTVVHVEILFNYQMDGWWKELMIEKTVLKPRKRPLLSNIRS